MLTYLIACSALILKPGPDIMCTLATALSYGRMRAIGYLFGLISGCMVWVAIVAFGFHVFLGNHPQILSALRIAGISYLAYLAVQALIEAAKGFRHPTSEQISGGASQQGWRLYFRGVIMAMCNPLTFIFFLMFLPGFLSIFPPEISSSLGILLLGLIFCLIVLIYDIPMILIADVFRTVLVRKPKFFPVLKLISGLILIAVIVFLILT